MRLAQLRKSVLEACDDLCQNGLMRNLGAGGNVSARDPHSGLIAVTPSQLRYDKMSSEDIVITDLDGKVIEALPGRIPTSEILTHTKIYRCFQNVNAVIHTHAPFSVAVASVEDSISALNYELLYFVSRSVPVIPFVMPGTEEMADRVTEALRLAPAIIIRNHGMFVVGKNLHEALVRAMALEDAAKLYYYASTLGQPKFLPQDVKKPG